MPLISLSLMGRVIREKMTVGERIVFNGRDPSLGSLRQHPPPPHPPLPKKIPPLFRPPDTQFLTRSAVVEDKTLSPSENVIRSLVAEGLYKS